MVVHTKQTTVSNSDCYCSGVKQLSILQFIVKDPSVNMQTRILNPSTLQTNSLLLLDAEPMPGVENRLAPFKI